MGYTGEVVIPQPVTVIETPEFVARTRKLMSDEDREELIGYLSRNPAAGVVVPGAGGVRKPSCGSVASMGSGGAREERRGKDHLLLSQYGRSAVRTDGIREE